MESFNAELGNTVPNGNPLSMKKLPNYVKM
jgi:hypothetical protein